MKRGMKKGISPVIATVLLIGMVVVIGLIIFIWFRGMVGESVTKFGKNIKLVCDDVEFDASYSSGILSIVNTGNVPIFKMDMKLSKAGEHSTKEINHNSYSEWDETGLGQGRTFSSTIPTDSSNEKMTVFPILIGTTLKGKKKTYVCGGQYGKDIIL